MVTTTKVNGKMEKQWKRPFGHHETIYKTIYWEIQPT